MGSNDDNSNNNNTIDHNHQINSTILLKVNHQKQQESSSIPLSYAFTPFTPSHPDKSMESKVIQPRLLFTNPLISKSDLATGNYYPEIINNIDRVNPNSDHWFCYNCTLRDDKWGMMRHLCKHNKKKNKKEKKN